MIELLIDAEVLAAALLPIVSMANHNVEMQRAERLRVLAEAVSHDLLERIGRSQSYPGQILQPSANPKLAVALDPWTAHPDLFTAMGYGDIADVAGRVNMHMSVSLERAVAPELDLLICEISWVSDGWTRKPEKYRYARFLTYGHMPQPR